MKLPDVNVLLYATNAAAAQHRVAHDWLTAALQGAEEVGLAWVAMLGFLRLSTRPGILRQPLPVDGALAVVHRWLAFPSAQIVHPGDRHTPLLGRLLMGAGTAGNLTTDAHLAALAIEHGATLVSFDRDFERFAGLSFQALR